MLDRQFQHGSRTDCTNSSAKVCMYMKLKHRSSLWWFALPLGISDNWATVEDGVRIGEVTGGVVAAGCAARCKHPDGSDLLVDEPQPSFFTVSCLDRATASSITAAF